MGLTIHYALHLAGKSSLTQAEETLQKLWFEAQQMCQQGLLTDVSSIRHFRGSELQHLQTTDGNEWQWAAIQSTQRKVQQERVIIIPAKQGLMFRTWYGPGCEEANFGLMRYPARVEFTEGSARSALYRTRLTGWRWASFCKTAYAAQPVQAHLSVIALLDTAQQIGLDVEVDDEGEYWERRDVVALAHEFREDGARFSSLIQTLSMPDSPTTRLWP